VPSRWEVQLAGPVNAAIPLAAPLAVVSGWLDDPQPDGVGRSPSAAPASAHDDQARRWTCGPLRTFVPGDGAWDTVTSLQVRLLDDGLGERLQAATRRSRVVRLGAHQYQIAAPACQVEQASWQELRRWSGARAWQIRCLTPACLRRRNRTSPLLAPESVARSLAERWRRLDEATAPPLPGHGAGSVWVSDIEGHNEVQILTRRARRGGQQKMEEEVVSGFVGRMRYVCDRGTDAEAADFGALIAFALFAGIGSHTTYGFGVVVPEPTWQPPTLHPHGS
jgi:CRISPR-associated endoribonuclease Cas6